MHLAKSANYPKTVLRFKIDFIENPIVSPTVTVVNITEDDSSNCSGESCKGGFSAVDGSFDLTGGPDYLSDSLDDFETTNNLKKQKTDKDVSLNL